MSTKEPKKSQKTKEEIYWAIFDAVIKLDIQKGPMAWKISDIARVSKVSRTLIYYYFGSSKENIINTAVDFLGREYFGLNEYGSGLWAQGKISDSVVNTRAMCQKSPHVYFFYMTRRHMENSVGQKLRSFEVQFRQKIKEFFPKLSKDGVDGMAACLFGLVSFPDLNEDGVRRSLAVMLQSLTYVPKTKN